MGLVPGFGSGTSVTLDSMVPCNVNGKVVIKCDNKGSKINFSGYIAKGDVAAKVTFSNYRKGTQKVTEVAEATVTISTEDVAFAKAPQPPHRGVGAKPHIIFIPGFEKGTEGIYLGRCVRGGYDINFPVMLKYAGYFDATADDCSDNPHPIINLEGEFTLASDVGGRFVFKNNLNNTQHILQEEGDITVAVSILEKGEKISIPKQPVHGGAGRNPLIYLQICGLDGTGYSKEILLDRCVKLGIEDEER